MADVHSQPALGEYLVREGVITQAQLNQALGEQLSSSRSIGRILVDMGFISESARMIILQKRFGFELIRLKDLKVDGSILGMIPYAFAEKHRAVSVRKEDENTLVVAMEDPSDILIVDAIKNQIGVRVKAVVASHEDVQAILNQYAQSQHAKGRATGAAVSHGIVYTILKIGAFPFLAFAPLAGFFVGIYYNFMGWEASLQSLFVHQVISWWDLALYIGLAWGLWTIVLFEINGLIFGRPQLEDEEE